MKLKHTTYVLIKLNESGNVLIVYTNQCLKWRTLNLFKTQRLLRSNTALVLKCNDNKNDLINSIQSSHNWLNITKGHKQ